MRILLDLQGCQLAGTEPHAGDYSRKLAKALLRQGNGRDFWLVMNGQLPNISKLRREFEPYIARHRMRVFDVPAPVALRDRNNAWRNSAAKLIRQAFIEHLDPDIVYLSDPIGGFDDDAVTAIGNRQTAQTVSTLFNSGSLLSKKPVSRRRQLWHSETIETLRKARLLLVKSENARQTAATQFDLDPERIISIPAGADEKFTWPAIADCVLRAFETIAQETSSGRTPRRINDAYRPPANGAARQTLCAALHDIRGNIGPTLADLAASAACIASNNTTSSTPRIFVDVSVIRRSDWHTGIQRVVKNILVCLNEMENTEFVVQPVYICKDSAKFLYDGTYATLSNDLKTFDGSAIEYGNADIFLGLDLSSDTPHHGEKRLREMRERGLRIFFVIYDLLPILYPDFFPDGVSQGFTSWLRSVTDLADGVICISKAVADELVEWLAKNPSARDDRELKIGYFHLGSDIEKHTIPAEMHSGDRDILGPITSCPFLLMVGTLEPRKGHAQAVAAFDLLWRQGIDINLVIVGKQGWRVEELIEKLRGHPQLQKRLFWFERASDALLLKLYETASGLLVASECEGFGLPLIEAARYNVPIIARDLPVFREIGGEHAYFFMGKAPEDLANAVRNWLELKARNEIPCSENIRSLTWEESATQLLNVLIQGEWLCNWPSRQYRMGHSSPLEDAGTRRKNDPVSKLDNNIAASP